MHSIYKSAFKRYNASYFFLVWAAVGGELMKDGLESWSREWNKFQIKTEASKETLQLMINSSCIVVVKTQH